MIGWIKYLIRMLEVVVAGMVMWWPWFCQGKKRFFFFFFCALFLNPDWANQSRHSSVLSFQSCQERTFSSSYPTLSLPFLPISVDRNKNYCGSCSEYGLDCKADNGWYMQLTNRDKRYLRSILLWSLIYTYCWWLLFDLTNI